uniref:Uncharacterized protein n=1 Tax=Caenorhabditis japonica TaxID=281687 RepID=A0A8R1EMF9_CAEJA
MWTSSSRMLILPVDMEAIIDDSIANTTGNQVSWIKGHVRWIGEQLAEQRSLPRAAFFRPDIKNVGSISFAALEGFGPILERREQRYNEMANDSSLSV